MREIQNDALPMDYTSRRIIDALGPLDRQVREIEGRWGPGRLQTLCDAALASRFAQAREQLDAAITGQPGCPPDPDEVVHYAAAMSRGWIALEAAAVAAGHTPEHVGRVWFIAHEGAKFALVQDPTDVATVMMQYPECSVWALPEVARVLASRDLTTVVKAKAAFPGATVTAIRPGVSIGKGQELDDSIPF